MIHSPFDAVKRGWRKVAEHPQLIYSIVVALVICGAFIFVAERFTGIAREAQDQLTHVRTSSLHSVFAEFAAPRWDDVDFLRSRIEGMLDRNETLTHFYLFDPAMEQVITGAGGDPDQVRIDDSVLIEAARARPGDAFTTEVYYQGQRAFRSWQAVSSEAGDIRGFVVTQQTLSQADQRIAASIRNGIYTLIGILALIMILFFRHARIIDYGVLYRKLKEVDSMKDDFISMASHELRSPLTVIRGYAEMITDSSSRSSEVSTYASEIDEAGRYLNDLVEDMLDVSRLEQGRMVFDLKEVDVAAIARKVVDSYEHRVRQKGLEITIESDRSCVATVDEGKMRQVITNLVSNALKYTKEGTVTLSVRSREREVVLTVEDTGIGMTAEERGRLFQKFSRIQTDETQDIRGTGLGLWITKQIIEQMGGSIDVESLKGVGSRFSVHVPR